MSSERVSIVLMAGGPATRLPGKLALPVEGEPMLLRAHRRLTCAGWPCVLSLREPLSASTAASIASEVAFDEVVDAGPLGGLLAAARRVATPLFFAAAADMPNMSVAFAQRLLEAYDAAALAPAVVLPRWPDGKVEPLAALYDTRAFVRGAAAALAAGKRKVTAAIEGLAVLPYDVRPDDAEQLVNVNTAQEYERVAGPRR